MLLDKSDTCVRSWRSKSRRKECPKGVTIFSVVC